MARTFRKNRDTNKLVPDGKCPYNPLRELLPSDKYKILDKEFKKEVNEQL